MTKDKKDKLVQLRLTDEQKAIFKEAADLLELTVSEFIVMAVKQKIDSGEPVKPSKVQIPQKPVSEEMNQSGMKGNRPFVNRLKGEWKP